MGRGDKAYVLGELAGLRDWRVFRQAIPLFDPTTREILGYEARFVGTAEYVREGGSTATAGRQVSFAVPRTFELLSVKEKWLSATAWRRPRRATSAASRRTPRPSRSAARWSPSTARPAGGSEPGGLDQPRRAGRDGTRPRAGDPQ
jgi:hypothetical protein